MPLVDVTYGAGMPQAALKRLAEVLPTAVAEAVDCQEEPWVGPPGVGDMEVRFHPKGPLDVGELACVVEVRTKLLPSRLPDKQPRADRLASRLIEAVPETRPLGVWLILCEGAWAQG